MRKDGLWLVLLLLGGGAGCAQQELAPSTSDGPLSIKPASPKAGKDGIYEIGSGVSSPILVRPIPAEYPPDAAETDIPHIVIVSAVIGADGIATNVQVEERRPHSSAFEESAISAVKKSQFQPGDLDGNPVPVSVRVTVRFFHFRPAIPMIQRSPRDRGWRAFGQETPPRQYDPLRLQPGDTPPRAINVVAAEFSEQARREKFGGVVLVSVVVDKEGLPIDPQVERSIGHGLDEKALEAVSQYRFEPAMRQGVPIAARITVEINFHFSQDGAQQNR